MSENKGYAHPEALVDADWVTAHLTDPKVRIIEVDVTTSSYDEGHIPGAVAFNWQKELQDQVVRAPISKAGLEELLSNAGVAKDTTIVLYGDNNNWFAAWALWILKYYGHNDVRLLDGGRVKWLADKREITTEVPSYAHTNYQAGEPTYELRALRDRVIASVGKAGLPWWMCAHLVNTAVSCSPRPISPGRCSSAVDIFPVPPIFPGHRRYVEMAHSNLPMN